MSLCQPERHRKTMSKEARTKEREQSVKTETPFSFHIAVRK